MTVEKEVPMFISVSFEKDGRIMTADCQTRDLMGRPDCQIGNFSDNWWIRPKKAQSLDFKGYGDLRGYQKAIKLSLLKRGCKNITF